jgi:hypothetical protein
MPEGLEYGVTKGRGDCGGNLHCFIITDIPSDICPGYRRQRGRRYLARLDIGEQSRL